jgi:hypothetical protein
MPQRSKPEFVNELARRLKILDTIASDFIDTDDDQQNIADWLTLLRAIRRVMTIVNYHDESSQYWIVEAAQTSYLEKLVTQIQTALGSKPSPSAILELARQLELFTETTTRLVRPGNDEAIWNITRLQEIRDEAETARRSVEVQQMLLQQVERVDSIVEDVQQAAGMTADSALTTAFSSYAEDEKRLANRFRTLGIGVLSTIAAFAIYTTINVPSGLGSSLAHLGIAASGLALFSYLAHESSQHRNAARWADIMSVQLRTLGAFTADMNTEQRESLRAQFGSRVFAEPSPVDSKLPASDLGSTVQAASDLIKLMRGGPAS